MDQIPEHSICVYLDWEDVSHRKDTVSSSQYESHEGIKQGPVSRLALEELRMFLEGRARAFSK